MSWFRRTFFKLSVKNLLLLSFIWLMAGFTIGTEILLGPVRWTVNLSRQMDWSKSLEDLVIKLVIGLFILGSLIISMLLVRITTKSKLVHIKLGIPFLILLFTAGNLYLWLNPQIFGVETAIMNESTSFARFTFGPYPTEERLSALKEKNYRAVISLLHPAVVPFEPKLLADELKAAKRVGIKIIHIPMLPWVSENKEALEKIQEIVESGKGRYYIHCYLGKDRVNVVKRLIEKLYATAKLDIRESESTARKIQDLKFFERGEIIILGDGIYLTPYPTHEEFMGYIIAGGINNIVLLMDPENPEDIPWIEKERKLLEKYFIGFELIPLSLNFYDPLKALESVQKVSLMRRAVVIHGFLSPSFRTEAFIQAFRSNLPSLPPSLFEEPLNRGKVTIIATNIAIGPRPEGPEFGSFLYRKGVRRYAYLGNPSSAEALEDFQITKAAGLPWNAFNPLSKPDELFKSLSKGGPWYVYGPILQHIQYELEERFGPAIPEKTKSRPITQKENQISSSSSKKRAFADNLLIYSLPDLKMIVLLGPVLLLYVGIGGAFAGWLRTRKHVRTPYTRKIFHFYVFSMAGILHLITGLPAVILFGSVTSLIVLYAVYRGTNFPFYEALARPSDRPHRTLFIIVPLITTGLGGAVTNLFFTRFAHIGYFVGGWGDAVGEPVGTRWGKHKFKVLSLAGVPATRSLEGSLSIFLVGILVAFLGLYAGGIPLNKAFYVALACGFVGTIVEAFSSHGLDNLTIQVAAAATAFILLS